MTENAKRRDSVADKERETASDKAGTSKKSGGSTKVKKKKKSRVWQWIVAVLLFLLMLAAIPASWFFFNYAKAVVPEPGEIETAQISNIFYSDNQKELARIVPPEGNRKQIPLDQVPEDVQNAVLAAEDRDFYSNPGFSFTGFARAFKNNIFGGDLQGGSTITQQYVKNALVGDARSGVGGQWRRLLPAGGGAGCDRRRCDIVTRGAAGVG